jgi:membrane protease YdiL (CAAX protease family)
MSEVTLSAGAEAPPSPRWRKIRLWAEMLALFVGTPVLMTIFFGQYPLLPTVMAFAAISMVLLGLTPGFRMRELLKGPVLGEWRIILLFTLAVAVVCSAVALIAVPHAFLAFPVYRTELWIMVMIGYPIASALPQEVIYRPLFFRRYGALFPNVGTAVVVNAVLFGLGHLFFMNWITIVMSGFGGLVMAWAYMRHGSFLLAWVLHSLAGQIVFTAGLGVFFYHGAVAH